MPLSFYQVAEALAPFAAPGTIEYRLNRAIERLLTHAKYRGTMGRLQINAWNGVVSLPEEYSTLLAVRVDGSSPLLMGSQWYQFSPGVTSGVEYSIGIAIDLGDGYLTIRDDLFSGAPKTLVASSSATGTIIINGVTVTLNTPVPGWTNPIVEIRRSVYADKLYDPTARAVEITLGGKVVSAISSGRNQPSFRRYRIPFLEKEPEASVDCLVRRRHVEMRGADFIPFDNVSALEHGIRALQFESEGDAQRAEYHWKEAVDILNRELASSKPPNEIPPVKVRHVPDIAGVTSFY